jgi:hypothetical protein
LDTKNFRRTVQNFSNLKNYSCKTRDFIAQFNTDTAPTLFNSQKQFRIFTKTFEITELQLRIYRKSSGQQNSHSYSSKFHRTIQVDIARQLKDTRKTRLDQFGTVSSTVLVTRKISGSDPVGLSIGGDGLS